MICMLTVGRRPAICCIKKASRKYTVVPGVVLLPEDPYPVRAAVQFSWFAKKHLSLTNFWIFRLNGGSKQNYFFHLWKTLLLRNCELFLRKFNLKLFVIFLCILLTIRKTKKDGNSEPQSTHFPGRKQTVFPLCIRLFVFPESNELPSDFYRQISVTGARNCSISQCRYHKVLPYEKDRGRKRPLSFFNE